MSARDDAISSALDLYLLGELSLEQLAEVLLALPSPPRPVKSKRVFDPAVHGG